MITRTANGKQRLASAVFATLLASVGVAEAQPGNPAEPPVIVVSGEGLVKAVPDQAFVRIGAETRSKVSKDAQAQNAVAMSAVQQRLGAAGIPKDAIRTASFDLQMEYEYNNGRQIPRGFVARNTIDVRVDDLARLG
ncbi:MAG: SIMPL domain-containing protein, partial [Vicinamibacterales bacterium]